VCLQNRYLPANVRAKELCADNLTTGGFCSVVWSRDADYYRQSDWRGRFATEGGGVLINQAIHTLDLLTWFMGAPRSVTADVYNYHLKDVIDVEDTAQGYIEFDNASALFYATTAAAENFPVEIALVGKRKIRLLADALFVDGEKVPLTQSPLGNVKPYWGAGHAAIITDFYNSLISGSPFAVDENEGAKSVELVLSIYESHGKRIAFGGR
jgi:predicted dehydrogenase